MHSIIMIVNRETAAVSNDQLAEGPVSLAERLNGLTHEQILVMDLLSQGYIRSQIAQARGAQTPEITSLIEDVTTTLDTTRHGAVYTLLVNGYIIPSQQEVGAAKEKIDSLDDKSKNTVRAVMTGMTNETAARQLGYTRGTYVYYTSQINKKHNTGSLVEIVRTGFAAGLTPAIERLDGSQPDDGETNVKEQQAEKPFQPKRVANLLSWIYPRDHVGKQPFEISESQAQAAGEIISQILSEYPIPKKRIAAANLRSTINHVLFYMRGQTIFSLAKADKRSESSVLIGLTSFAPRLAQEDRYDDFMDEVDARLKEAEKQAHSQDTEDIIAIGKLSVGQLVNLENRDSLLEIDYSRKDRFPQNLDAELVTILNFRRQPVHVDDITELFTNDPGVVPNLRAFISQTLDNLSSEGYIFDEGDGYYSTWREEQQEPVEAVAHAEETASRPILRLVEPDSFGTLDYHSDGSRHVGRPATRGQILDEMIKAAIPGNGESKFGRGGKRNRRR